MTNVLKTYPRSNLTFIYGEGSYLIEASGDRYLDFGSGIAVNSLGYSHPVLNNALIEQAQKLWHVSNVYNIPEQEVLAKKLCELSFADYVFFCNSGTESIEAAIKIARRYFYITEKSNTKNKIISFTGSFHGRTIGALAAGGPSKLEGFNTSINGFINLTFGDHESLEKSIDNDVAAILIEPIQGEGGVSEVPAHCLEAIRKICDEKNILLIFDEVQCGIGRSGKMFAHQWCDVVPDIMTIAKALGNGFPIGACLTSKRVGDTMGHGTHGSTFGGNPLACSVGISVLELMNSNFFSNLKKTSDYLDDELSKLLRDFPEIILEVRGKGLMLGLKCKIENTKFVDELRKNKMLTIKASDNVVRLLPPLNISIEDCDFAIATIRNVCKNLS
tara:strand:- start:800 stop:1963 length:1164 start_codon:yes stop_codon:yes gene_type:complete